ncbi:hypothetical protein NPIL_493381 [Nephila pilipes]|uniref:Uncharacterized protein n=1 Tax=Nephila pilipes TaxID=299642 RepID=A0A8X6UNW7_NEPPI|nr:hypothetical protein NPIL_493381 [Nephila pilipes]
MVPDRRSRPTSVSRRRLWKETKQPYLSVAFKPRISLRHFKSVTGGFEATSSTKDSPSVLVAPQSHFPFLSRLNCAPHAQNGATYC